MEIELSKHTIDAIAHRAATIILQKLKAKDERDNPKMVTTKEAAAILKISPYRMRQIADRFPHIKGTGEKGKLLFLKSALLERY